ncbi:acyl-CoA dehydratase activase-related protein [Paenibacillus odorifer]|uniref:acyl-CoA dehydratase activase-related protein n=1 Tax=Paenibacillus odorifer TaxID=189426 RepID=UPI002DBBD4C4|nr:acyl-CoA dehydratase activase-related protein [Paenibacillus odorifer]MEC0129604.1 acyl-CoA dehydratase activase-related protein [Paenibacillus odorifer]MEC0223389.1 acyl-CoA dehydratase activase-related protein [Paenibacillus odorifer]
MLHIGLDIGSTTAKLVVIERDIIVYQDYVRHYSDIKKAALSLLSDVRDRFPERGARLTVSGSSGLSLSKLGGVPFIQEVIACTKAISALIPECDTAIELGGEDAKIIYLRGGIEQRMNTACAGGTGAFIDQMAALLQTDPAGLNVLAEKHERIYPIASRCGVFAKSDVQPLLNEGARREDVAASIFQSIVNQTISGLACGRPIRGRVAFLGGPLTFLPALRQRFAETLELAEEDILFPERSQYFVAIGAALSNADPVVLPLSSWITRIAAVDFTADRAADAELPPLFENAAELAEFRLRHGKASAARSDLALYRGPCYLGIDAGSTTTKLVLTGSADEILYTFYGSNKGNPLHSVSDALKEIYRVLPEGCHIAGSYVTGYGEGLIKAALRTDGGEVETVAHYKAASKFMPKVDFILDIGGQDMKCIKIRGGAIDSLMLNEACSAGCGSFLESFASALGLGIEEFAKTALEATQPVNLGSRCTVFMNSKVKQVQKEGASLADLSAGLAYSVIKNALQKVIKIRNPEDLGRNIIVQGGTFYNEAVLRAFESLTGRTVVRPDIAGVMGAYGCALIAREQAGVNGSSTLLGPEELASFKYEVSSGRCGRCGNNCALTISRFPDKSFYVTGNRCERGAGVKKEKNVLPNLMQYKYERFFEYESLPETGAWRGTVGIPRTMNMFENYPFWHTLFTKLGYRVILSPKSSKKLFESGMDTIPSESICYPAKMAHGHVQSLIGKGVDFIFYPAVVYEKKEDEAADNHFNCPVVASYPEVIRNNMDGLKDNGIKLVSPFLTFDDISALTKGLVKTFTSIPRDEITSAVQAGLTEADNAKSDVRTKGEETLVYLADTGTKGILLCGHPYHADPEINHGIADMITGMGLAVLTEDSVCHLDHSEGDVAVVNQWTYHARMYRAARLAAVRSDLELVQLTSFGCGIDAITCDAVQDIMERHNKVYTLIKIDEISNLGAARIRLRSLLAAMREREKGKVVPQKPPKVQANVLFTKEMKETYTILAPQMSPIHFELFEQVFRDAGYRLKILETTGPEETEEGLRYVNNDACYPAIVTIGQILSALKSGEYDPDRTAVIMSQTGGGCRATNYISLLRKALKDSDLEQIPVISLNASGMENQPGFRISLKLANRLIAAACYGDLMMRMLNHFRPHEVVPGSAEVLFRKGMERCKASLSNFSFREYKRLIREIVAEFCKLPVTGIAKPRVGIVGEILIKFHPDANNRIIEMIEAEGGEAVMPDFLDFIFYCVYNPIYKAEQFGKSKRLGYINPMLISYLEIYRKPIKVALEDAGLAKGRENIYGLAEKASRLVSVGNQMGEGWFLTAEMMDLLDNGVNNIACIQPFACLPNHITGRGMIKGLKELYPGANIVAIDYDAGVSVVNQANRIKLMMSIASSQEETKPSNLKLPDKPQQQTLPESSYSLT